MTVLFDPEVIDLAEQNQARTDLIAVLGKVLQKKEQDHEEAFESYLGTLKPGE